GDESTNLYKRLVDGKTKVMDIGATAVGSWLSDDQGQPVTINVGGVKPDKLDAKTVAQVRALILDELKHVASLPPHDPELVAFNDRAKSTIAGWRRRYNKFLDTPPGFGFRGTGSSWINHLHQLNKTPGFQKSLTLKQALAAASSAVSDASTNPWTSR